MAQAPAAFTAWATPTIWLSLSTEQGPAITTSLSPADGHAAAHIDYRVVRVVFAVGLFVGFGHTHNPVPTPSSWDGSLLIQPAGVPFGAENGGL